MLSFYMLDQDQEDETILGPRIGEGRSAIVYELLGTRSGLCAKLYDADAGAREIWRRAVTDLARRRFRVLLGQCPQSHMQLYAAWPVGLLFEDESFVGYAMNKFAQATSLNDYLMDDLQFDLHRPSRSSYRRLLARAEVAHALVTAVGKIHDQSMILGDISGENVLISSNDRQLGLIDCDTFRFEHSETVREGYFFTQDCSSPRVLKSVMAVPPLEAPTQRTREDDEFAVAVLAFRLLVGGYHPFHTSNNSSGSAGLVGNVLTGRFCFGSRASPPKHASRRAYDELTSPTMRRLFAATFEFDARHGLSVWQQSLAEHLEGLRHRERQTV